MKLTDEYLEHLSKVNPDEYIGKCKMVRYLNSGGHIAEGRTSVEINTQMAADISSCIRQIANNLLYDIPLKRIPRHGDLPEIIVSQNT